MMVEYLAAWLLPVILGAAVCRLADGAHWPGRIAADIGGGWLAGLVLAAIACAIGARADVPHALARVLPWLGAFAVLAWVAAAVRAHRMPRARPTAIAFPSSRGLHLLWWLLAAAIVLRLLLLADEASLRPVFPWDAWSAWAIKPKTWMLLGHAEPYVSMADWLAQPHAPLRTAAAWNYPELLAWIEIWFASGAGGWDESLVNLAWCGALAAFALALYGHARRFGLHPCAAMGFCYALVSLPLVDAHVALAGYADLWIGVAAGMASLAWARWLVLRERAQWLLALGWALCLPAIKLEGSLWLLAFAFVMLLERLARTGRRAVAAAVVIAILGLLLSGGIPLPVFGLGVVRVGWNAVAIPGFGSFDLAWHDVGGSVVASLFQLPNWHLLWYVFPLLLALRWRAWRGDAPTRMFGLLVLLQWLLLFFLFFLTAAAAWAADFTSANRLILQIVPTAFVFAILLVRRVPAQRGEWLVAVPAPGRRG